MNKAAAKHAEMQSHRGLLMKIKSKGARLRSNSTWNEEEGTPRLAPVPPQPGDGH